jgi:SAM-dependent methyltransferase
MRTARVTATTLRQRWAQWRLQRKSSAWVRKGRVPGTRGDTAAKWVSIERALAAADGQLYGHNDAGLDERVVEYPWAFDRLTALHTPGAHILDAGSVLNHPRLLAHCRRAGHCPLSIVTLRYEGYAEVSDDVHYEFADLRMLPYRDAWFPLVVSLSTLEHVGMDNAGYGDTNRASIDPTSEAVRAMQELRRVTTPGGTALVSVPFGLRAHRGWFRVFDAEDLDGLTRSSGWRVEQARFFRATRDGWRERSMDEVRTAGFNDPSRQRSSGAETTPEWVAAAEAVALLELIRV